MCLRYYVRYYYEALNDKGEDVSGTIETLSKEQAIRELRNAGLFPTKVVPDGSFSKKKKKKKKRELKEWWKKFVETVKYFWH